MLSIRDILRRLSTVLRPAHYTQDLKQICTRAEVDSVEASRIFTTPDGIDRESHIIVHYLLIPCEGLSIGQAAARTALITSLRTLVPLPYEPRAERLRQAGKVLMFQNGGQAVIAFPLDICSPNEGLTQLLLVISTGAEYIYTQQLWIGEIELPKSFLERFQGPRFGIQGIRERFKIPSRPLIGVTVKPRHGVALKKIVDQCRESLLGGADYLVDDMLMVDPDGDLAFTKRVPLLAKTAMKASSKTGESKWYVVNISASPKRAKEYARIAQAEGVGALKVNAFTMGFPTVEEITNDPDIDLPVITTNMGVCLLTRPKLPASTGMSEALVSKLSRIAGADGVHLGSVAAGCFAQESWHPAIIALQSDLQNIRPSFVVVEGDITLANAWENISVFGPDVMLETSSGILGYPGGARKGADAFRMLVENIPCSLSSVEAHEKLMELARRDRLVEQALAYFGYSPKT